MINNPYAQYQALEETPETKEELLVKVYEKILEKLRLAKLAMEEGEIKQKAELLSKITDGIVILQNSLDFEKGGEIAQKLSSIYDFCVNELLLANLRNDIKHVENVIEVLTPIYEGFKEALKNEN